MNYKWIKKNYGIIIVDFADKELAHKILFNKLKRRNILY